MPGSDQAPPDPEPTEAQVEANLRALQEAQQAFLEQSFKWLIDFVGSYFPEDQLALEDAVTDVHFLHRVVEGGKPLGALVYRFRKIQDKKAYFNDLAQDYREGLEVPEVLFVDSETADFAPPAPGALEGDEALFEIPAAQLTAKLRELREELKRRARLRQLRESL
ncbi:MAG TPA: hypothetical protein VMU88_09290 [bacterium]|nr:hypothetical protein [bacterium]